MNSKELELDELRRKGRRMAKSFQEYGKGIADRLKTAMDIAPNEPGMWDKLGHAIEDLGEALADLPGQVGDLLADVGDWIKAHADWITVAASVVGVIAIFCPALAPLAIGLRGPDRSCRSCGCRSGCSLVWSWGRDSRGRGSCRTDCGH
ncbi:hypothetical protein AB0G54_40760 [Streptomyces yokosukanensis]|uniref:hypothetical protein n=1 Tax=Streptomyces yokosukanensis TaxID=67386 RepID=UPI003443E71F